MPFTYTRAVGALSALDDPREVFLAGGTDLLPLYKVGLVDPGRVVDIKTSDLPATIERDGDAWRIGALATLADVEDHAGLRETLPALGQSVEQAATRQLRNRATVGGNLLQRPRCRYYRAEAMTCWFDGGDTCPARDGRNEHHAIFQTGPCVAVQPSDLASVLVATDAEVTVRGDGDRSIPVADLLAPPDDERRSLHLLGEGEIIVSVHVPDPGPSRSCYLKAMDRAAWAFALAGLAAIVDVGDDGLVVRADLVASGVASVPWRLTAAEEALVGRTLGDDAIAAAATAAADGAEPLQENRYKRTLLSGLTDHALRQLQDTSGR